LGLANVTIVKVFGKNTSLWTCSDIAAYYAAISQHVHNDVFLPNILATVTLARPARAGVLKKPREATLPFTYARDHVFSGCVP
jgi:hypothetical protein